MKIDLSSFFDESDEMFFQATGKIAGDEISLDKKHVKIVGDIDYDLQIFKLDDGKNEIDVDIKYSYEEPCNRCLDLTTSLIETKISGELVQGKEEDYESDEELENIVFYNNNLLDLSYYIKTQVYLALPMQTICSNTCEGLCSICGINLNKEKCNCEIDTVDPRLAKLKDFFPKQ